MDASRWVQVDEFGHVPGLAASLPVGYEVLLDGMNQIADMRPVAPPEPAQEAPKDVQIEPVKQAGG